MPCAPAPPPEPHRARRAGICPGVTPPGARWSCPGTPCGGLAEEPRQVDVHVRGTLERINALGAFGYDHGEALTARTLPGRALPGRAPSAGTRPNCSTKLQEAGEARQRATERPAPPEMPRLGQERVCPAGGARSGRASQRSGRELCKVEDVLSVRLREGCPSS